jgi:cytochrome c551/c552
VDTQPPGWSTAVAAHHGGTADLDLADAVLFSQYGSVLGHAPDLDTVDGGADRDDLANGLRAGGDHYAETLAEFLARHPGGLGAPSDRWERHRQ